MNKLTLLLGLSCAAALLGGCADRSTMVPAQLTQLAPLTRAMQPGVKAVPSCKGQHTTKQYAESQAKSLNYNGGTLCVPKFQGWGGGLKYPGGASGVSASLISSTTAYAPSFFPPGVSAIFWIQFKPSGFVKFNSKLPAGVSLASSKLKVKKAYTIEGADYYASLFRVLPACYTIAANGTYEVSTGASQGALDEFAQRGSGKTLRQLAIEKYDGGGLRLIGSPDRVAARMDEAMQEVGGDGFLISTPYMKVNRRQIIEVAEGLVPALQRRGLVRTEYTKSTLRETLREF